MTLKIEKLNEKLLCVAAGRRSSQEEEQPGGGAARRRRIQGFRASWLPKPTGTCALMCECETAQCH